MKVHPAAELFPMMAEAEIAILAEDIKRNGLAQPLVTHKGALLDGRNRLRACELAAVDPRFVEWNNGNDPVTWVISQNLHRRHLSESQRAIIAAKLANKPEGRPAKNSANLHCISLERAADLFNVSRREVADAKAILREAPEAAREIELGQRTVFEVKRELRRAAASKKIAEAPSGKYRVLYADPPWSYGDSRATLPGTTGASAHYESMTIQQLCDLPVIEWADDNAVLFLWVTSPLLFDALPVIKGWGFTYKASFIWDKIKHNLGHYNSVRHEFLLVCTRGSCVPDNMKLFDSVQSIERTEHSSKPEEFREIIQTLYPHGKRLELFARKRTDGWEAYGNEC